MIQKNDPTKNTKRNKEQKQRATQVNQPKPTHTQNTHTIGTKITTTNN